MKTKAKIVKIRQPFPGENFAGLDLQVGRFPRGKTAGFPSSVEIFFVTHG
ncbi:MAG: hypothetical protein WC604_02830 [Candidatus Gracilibacteria bacterium]